MRSVKILFTAILIAGSIISCDVLDQNPENSLDPQSVFKTEQGARNALRGVYSDLEGANTDNIRFGILATGLATHTGSAPNYGAIDNNNVEASNTATDNIWINMYSVINDANGVVKNVPPVKSNGFTDKEKANIVAQAKAVRAYAYHMLIRWYGTPTMGVPLVLEPTEDFSNRKEANVPRAATPKVYKRIINDLKTAINKLLGVQPASPVVTKWGADALLARVYLDAADRGFSDDGYQRALSLANDVIKNGPFILVPSYTSIFEGKQNSTEAIWELPFSTQNANSLSFSFLPQGAGGRYEIGPATKLVKLYQPDDERASVNLKEAAGRTYLGKYYRTDGSDDEVVIRLAEVILISAEADVKANGTVAARKRAIKKINQIRNRAGIGDSSLDAASASNQDVINAIIEERARELNQEGLCWHTLVRTGKVKTELGLKDRNTRWPIPQREIEANPKLKQNPGY